MMGIWSTHLEMVPRPGCGSGLLPMWMPPPPAAPPLAVPFPPLPFPFPIPLPLPLLLKKSSITRLGWRLEGVRVKAGGERPAASASFSVDLSGRLAVGRMGGFGGWQTHASGQHKSRHKGVQKY